MEEKKLADRVSDEQVKRIELMVSDVDARDTKDEVFEEAIDSFVTSQMNGDEGEAGAGNVSETATLSFSENGIVSPEKKAVLLSFGSEKEEKKLGDDRIIHDQVENNILLVSDVVFVEAIVGFQADDGLHEDLPSKATPEHSMDDLEEENSNDKEVKDSKVSGETHGEANLQHITEGEAAPGFVTSKMNGDEGESGAEHVNEKVTCSFSENGIVSPEKKQLVAEVIEETRNDGTEEENKEENADVSAGMETEQEAGKREGADKNCFENESGAQRNGETVAEYTTVKYASGDSIQVASGEKSLNDSIEVACAGTSSPLELMTSPRSRLLSFCQLLRWELLVGGDCIFHIIGIAHDKSSWLLDDFLQSFMKAHGPLKISAIGNWSVLLQCQMNLCAAIVPNTKRISVKLSKANTIQLFFFVCVLYIKRTRFSGEIELRYLIGKTLMEPLLYASSE
ncbi:BnaC03g59940D [Brassica napus]|uniref:BnaC03g59940D protein n=2 Tax=Brassica napus TaxID=3708 RepID=A0A078FIY8_BRANA|nr:BnaC03g59940D [Brassica napus]